MAGYPWGVCSIPAYDQQRSPCRRRDEEQKGGIASMTMLQAPCFTCLHAQRRRGIRPCARASGAAGAGECAIARRPCESRFRRDACRGTRGASGDWRGGRLRLRDVLISLPARAPVLCWAAPGPARTAKPSRAQLRTAGAQTRRDRQSQPPIPPCFHALSGHPHPQGVLIMGCHKVDPPPLRRVGLPQTPTRTVHGRCPCPRRRSC